jgi:hypothetical protein
MKFSKSLAYTTPPILWLNLHFFYSLEPPDELLTNAQSPSICYESSRDCSSISIHIIFALFSPTCFTLRARHSTPARPSSESKPVGELQPKLRKKMYPSSGPGFQEPSLTPKSGRKSFTAVVYRKLDEPSLKKTFDVPNAVSVAHITTAPATPR